MMSISSDAPRKYVNAMIVAVVQKLITTRADYHEG
jgi:hypothetical protein